MCLYEKKEIIYMSRYYKIRTSILSGKSDTNISEEDMKYFLSKIGAVHRREDGDTLRAYPHRERPWKETRGNLKEGERDHKDIPESLMMEYYHN